MKRVFVVIVTIAGVGGLIALLTYHPKSAQVGATSSSAPVSSPVDSPSDTGTSAAASTTTQAKYKDGTYTGSTVDVGYGPVQVQAVISGGKLTGVNFLQMPFAEDRSAMIASQAKPLLLQEALQAQSANVDTVSGATQDSQGFMNSLSSALNQAGS